TPGLRGKWMAASSGTLSPASHRLHCQDSSEESSCGRRRHFSRRREKNRNPRPAAAWRRIRGGRLDGGGWKLPVSCSHSDYTTMRCSSKSRAARLLRRTRTRATRSSGREAYADADDCEYKRIGLRFITTKPSQGALSRGSDSRGVHRKRSRSKDRRRSRSHSRGHRRRSKERSRSPRRNASRGRKSSRRRERSRERKEPTSPTRRRRHKEPERSGRAKPTKTQKEYEREEKDAYGSDREGSGSASEEGASPCTQQNGR
ncbi:hypothetical protein CRUP_025400, partial [Coryphaenoides rupestris]